MSSYQFDDFERLAENIEHITLFQSDLDSSEILKYLMKPSIAHLLTVAPQKRFVDMVALISYLRAYCQNSKAVSLVHHIFSFEDGQRYISKGQVTFVI